MAGCATAHAPATTARVIDVPAAGGSRRVAVRIEPALVDAAGDHRMTPLAPARGAYLLLLDSYASRPQSLSRCQAGYERWVRLIDLRRGREIFSRLVESCLKDVVPGEPPAQWDANGRGFTVNLLSGPPVHAVIAADGTVRVAE